MKIIRDIPYTKTGKECIDLYLPEDKPKSTFLYFHGGGIEAGDKNHADAFASYLADRGVALFSANYRMYPTAKYPEFIIDSAQAVKWSLDYIRENFDGIKLYVGGSSAGGYISMMLSFDTSYLKNVGVNPDEVAGYLHDAGQPTAHFNVLRERGIDSRRIIIDESAPLYHIGTSEKYPPMRFIVSDNDITSRYEQTMLTLKTLEHFGYEGYDYVLMHGKHVQYVHEIGEDGVSPMGKLIYDFISKFE